MRSFIRVSQFLVGAFALLALSLTSYSQYGNSDTICGDAGTMSDCQFDCDHPTGNNCITTALDAIQDCVTPEGGVTCSRVTDPQQPCAEIDLYEDHEACQMRTGVKEKEATVSGCQNAG